MGDTLTATAIVAVAVKDQGGGAEDIRLYHNGALVGGTSRGVAVTQEGCPAGSTCFALELLPGTNTLEATAFSTARVEAERARVVVTVPGTRPTATLHLIVVGINTYQNPRYSLNYGRPDAKAFVDSLLAGGQGIFSAVVVDSLYDSAATGLAIKAAFRRAASSAKPQDLFVFFYAGHGIAEQVGDSTRFYLVPTDVTQMSDPEQLAQRGMANLQELFDAVPGPQEAHADRRLPVGPGHRGLCAARGGGGAGDRAPGAGQRNLRHECDRVGPAGLRGRDAGSRRLYLCMVAGHGARSRRGRASAWWARWRARWSARFPSCPVAFGPSRSIPSCSGTGRIFRCW